MGTQEIVNKIREYSNLADVDYSVYKQVSYFAYDTTRVIVAVAFALITMLLTLLTASDIAYLTIPPFRDFIYKKDLDGSQGTSKLKIVTPQARNAVIEADTVSTGKSPLGIYIKHRILAWVQFIAVLIIFLTAYEPLVKIIGDLVVEIYFNFRSAF